MNLTLDNVRELAAQRRQLGDADPEAGHGDIDAAMEAVVFMTATGHPDAAEAASVVADLLDDEDRNGWRRWYA